MTEFLKLLFEWVFLGSVYVFIFSVLTGVALMLFSTVLIGVVEKIGEWRGL